MALDLLITAPIVAGQVLNTINSIVKYFKIGQGNTSLTSITKTARVEPLVLIGNDCVNLEYMPDVMQSLNTIFAGYYLQALSLITTIESVSAGKILERLNPNTNDFFTNSAFENYKDENAYSGKGYFDTWKLSAESYKYKLPTQCNFNKYDAGQIMTVSTAMEAVNNNKNGEDKKENKIDRTGARFDDAYETIGQNANLSVGKIFNVTVKEKDNEINLPISIRLLVSQVPEYSLVKMLTLNNRDTNLFERYHAWKSGRIEFIKDLILCQDMIDESKNAMMKDKDGAFSEVIRRSRNSKFTGIFSQKSNIASASNIYVISDSTKDAIEDKLGSKLSNYKTRSELFRSGYMMILVVVDRTWERITFYHRGINTPTIVGIKDIKASNKGSGPDVGDILKAYQLGNSPSI